jgi:hypothetical protein
MNRFLLSTLRRLKSKITGGSITPPVELRVYTRPDGTYLYLRPDGTSLYVGPITYVTTTTPPPHAPHFLQPDGNNYLQPDGISVYTLP